MKRYEKIWLNQINSIIDNNLENPDFQLSNITDALEISRTKLYRNILKLTGQSPNRYIQSKRLEKAKEILEIGVYPTIKRTASEVGFRSSDYFSKLFYKKYQILPRQILKG